MNEPLGAALNEAMQLAVQRHRSGDLASAEALYRRVLAAAPSTLGALHNLGTLLADRGELESGLALLGEGIRIAPKEAGLKYARAVVLQHAGRLDAAVADYRAVLRIDPGNAMAWENLAVALQDGGAYTEAANACRRALKHRHDSLIAWRNLINVLRADGKIRQALVACEEALRLHPTNGDLRFLHATTLLTLGQFEQGWREYEWRYAAVDQLATKPPRMLRWPKWDGSTLVNRSLLLYGEQGLGDEIMFAACVPDVVEATRQLILECDSRLVPLFQRSFPTTDVVARPDDLYADVTGSSGAPDWRLSTASLPGFLRHSEAEFRGGRPYLRADPMQVAALRERLMALGPGLKIGLSWRGGLDPRARVARSIPLEHFRALIDGADAQFISVQYGDHEAEIDAFNATGAKSLHRFADIDPLREVDRCAALLSALDLVISIDNSTVHLAGALGVQTWVLLPGHADFRWLRDRADSPWYRSARLFRQRRYAAEEWPRLLEQVLTHLRQLPNAGTVPPTAPTDSMALPSLSRPQQPAHVATGRRLLLLNDTSYWYHWGCTCTSLALQDQIRARGYSVSAVPISRTAQLAGLPTDPEGFDDNRLFDAFSRQHPDLWSALAAADLVVINGEGSLHGVGPGALGLLYLAHLASTRLGTRVQIVNHSVYPGAPGAVVHEAALQVYSSVYQKLDFVAVREPASARALQAIGIPSAPAFDCLPLFVDSQRLTPNSRSASLVIAGSVAWSPAMIDQLVEVTKLARSRRLQPRVLVGANAYPASDEAEFVRHLMPRLDGRCELVVARNEREWLQTIADANLLVSGRFHHSIAAAVLGTPFLLGDSNTGKLNGLLERLELAAEHVRFGPDRPPVERAAALLDAPEPGLLKPAVRQQLMQLAQANFDKLDS